MENAWAKVENNMYLEKLHTNYSEDEVEQQCDEKNIAYVL